MPPMRHVCPLGGLERLISSNRDVRQGIRKESQAEFRRGPHGSNIILPGIWTAAGGGVVVQLPWEGLDRIIQ